MIRLITYDPPLSLTMYQELAKHLEQLEGVKTELLPPTSAQFDYSFSQVGGIRVEVTPGMSPDRADILEQILLYYGKFEENIP